MKNLKRMTKWMGLLLSLCVALSIVPVTAFADETADSTSDVYTHTYHTKVKVTANVTVQDSDGKTVNTYQVIEEGDDFIEGNVSDDAVQAEIAKIENAVNSQLPSDAVKSNRKTSLTFDHFESSNKVDQSCDAILISDGKELEDASQQQGNTTKNLDVHEFQVYAITEDWTVKQSNCDAVVAITTVDFGNVWKNLDSTQPVAFTTELNPNTDCPNQMEIDTQKWIPEGSGDAISSTDPQCPVDGTTYCYQITLVAKDGYGFPCTDNDTGEFTGKIICDGSTIYDGTSSSGISATVANSQAITISGYPTATATGGGSQDDFVVKNVVINNAPVSCTVGETPKAAAKGDSGAYTFYEYWEEWTKTENGMEPVKFWYSDAEQMSRVPADQRITAFEEGKTYSYSVIAQANENYTFASKGALSVKLNGEDYTDKSEVASEGKSLMIGPGPFMKPTAVGAPDYKIVEGADSAWTQNSDGTLTIRANGNFDKFTGVKMDGALIDAKNYTAVSGSTVITLNADYLKTLSIGTHKLTVLYTDGECSTNLAVKEASSEAASDQTSPKDGDQSDTTTPAEAWKPTTPDEKKRYACMGQDAVQYTLAKDNDYRIVIKNAMQGPLCFQSFEAVLEDYTIGRTYNVYTLPNSTYSMDKEIQFTIKIPSDIYKKDREYKMICVTKNGQPIVYEDMDSKPETITVKTNKFYAYALIYKDLKK